MVLNMRTLHMFLCISYLRTNRIYLTLLYWLNPIGVWGLVEQNYCDLHVSDLVCVEYDDKLLLLSNSYGRILLNSPATIFELSSK